MLRGSACLRRKASQLLRRRPYLVGAAEAGGQYCSFHQSPPMARSQLSLKGESPCLSTPRRRPRRRRSPGARDLDPEAARVLARPFQEQARSFGGRSRQSRRWHAAYPRRPGEGFLPRSPGRKNYWSPELCFVPVPIKGTKKDTIHLIDEDLAMDYLPSGKIKRFRLVLATKPFDVFFLLEVPSQNLDNNWNAHGSCRLRTGQDAVDAGFEPQGGRHRRLQGR